jgi:hypothetical protein
VTAALLEFPGSPQHLAFRFQPPQPVEFDGAGLEFSLGVVERDAWFVGFWFCPRGKGHAPLQW